MNLNNHFINFCKNNNLEINSDQIDIIKKLNNFYNNNFNKSFLKKFFSKKKTKIIFLFTWKCRCRKNHVIKFFF